MGCDHPATRGSTHRRVKAQGRGLSELRLESQAWHDVLNSSVTSASCKGLTIPGKGADLGMPGHRELAIGFPGTSNPAEPGPLTLALPFPILHPWEVGRQRWGAGTKGPTAGCLPYVAMSTHHPREGLRPGPHSWEVMGTKHTQTGLPLGQAPAAAHAASAEPHRPQQRTALPGRQQVSGTEP